MHPGTRNGGNPNRPLDVPQQKALSSDDPVRDLADTGVIRVGDVEVTGVVRGDATSADLYQPQSVAVDQYGNVFFINQNAVLRLDAVTGILTLAAGNGLPGFFSGVSGPGTYPTGIAVDLAGNLYIADYYNDRIRKVSNGVNRATRAAPG